MAWDGVFDRPLSPAAVAVITATARDLVPPPDLSISEWVDEGNIILSACTGSPKAQNGPVPFEFEGVEYLREPSNRPHPDDPSTRCTVRGGAQSAKSSIGQLTVGWYIVHKPQPIAIGLPSAGEIVKYDDAKLAPIIEESPELRRRVKPISTKSSEGSSTKKKRQLTGATISLFNLASPKELQMISAGIIVLEEVGNALVQVGNRGSPVKQARERQAAYSGTGSKELMLSTPSELGECEVTKAEEAGDQRRFYGECQQCAGFFHLTPEGFKRGERNGTPHHFVCPPDLGGCGGVLEESDMPAFRAAGIWLPTFKAEDPDANPASALFVSAEQMAVMTAPGEFPHRGYRVSTRDCEGREPSYYVWQAMCGLISWAKIATSIAEAKTPSDLKALEQQVYGRAWDPSVEAMDWEDIHKLCEEYDAGLVPSRAALLTAFADVQGGYLEWGVIAWGPGGEWWVVDRGIIEGDTSGDEVWAKFDGVTRQTYPHEDGGELLPLWGVDTGYRTQKVYAFCRGRPNLYAMDGRPGWKLPAIGRPKAVKVIENGRTKGRVKLWPTGTWELKSLLYWSLKVSTEAGYQTPAHGRGHWSRREDEAWCQQITAEGLAEEKDKRTAETKRWWRKLRERNEWVDIWVGARALAFSAGVGVARKDGAGEACDWEALAARRLPDADPDLFDAKRPAPAHAVRTDDDVAPPAPKPVRRFFRSKRSS